MGKLESKMKAEFKDEVMDRLPHVRMLEPKTSQRSEPDLVILGPLHPTNGRSNWAAFDFKRSRDADHQPNQDFKIDYLDEMGWAEFVYPDNVEEVLDGLERLFETP